ncbi:MAG: LytR/AlgR family response regulator transcription factor [Terriglobales bacterium]
MPIRTVIVDDEQLARNELGFLLRSFPDVEVVAQGENGVEAVTLVREHHPDLLFLDVQMPGLDGFGVIKRLSDKKLVPPQIIFATAFDQYALKAFEVNAIDYLLKPFDLARLGQAIQKVRRFLESGSPTQEKMDRLLQLLEERPANPSRILLKANGKQLLLDPNEMVCARVEDGVITVITTQFEGQSNCRTLEEFQANLDPRVFWRAHRSYLVNLHRIKEVVPWFNSSYQLRMDDKKQTEVPVSRTQSRHLRELFNL